MSFRSSRLAAPAALALVAAAAASSPAFAWGAMGHRLIGSVGAAALPPEIPAFLRTPDAIQQIGELSREPDRSKDAGNPHDSDLNPAHFTDIDDQGKIGGVIALTDLPPTRAAYEAALRAGGTDGFVQGYLPYSIEEGWQQLAKDFAIWRVETWAIGHAKSAQQRAWFMRDRRLREALTLRDLGYWSHFVGDASQPLHVSMHYNGWGQYPNPNGYTQDKVHAPFEGALVFNHVKAVDVRARLAPYRACACTIQQRTEAYLAATEAQVIPFYEMVKAGGLKDGDPRGRDFAAERLAAGASQLRDMVVDAWRASATVSVGYPPAQPADIEAGKADAYSGLYGPD